MEFLALTQGSMTVGEYAAKFEELSRYHPHYQNVVDECLRCVKFTNGLRPEIKEAIRMQEIHHFPTLVNRYKIFEEDHKERVTRAKNYGPQHPQKKGFERKKPYHHSQHRQGSSFGSAKKPAVMGDANTSATTLKCFECGGLHLKRDCPKKNRSVTCFTCGQQGHYAKDCPEVKKEKNGNGGSGNPGNSGNNNNNKNNNGGRASHPKTTGKVFTMSGIEASKSDAMIEGKCVINETSLSVMYDSRASHSFIAESCVKRLGLLTVNLPFDLSVSTPGTDPILTSKACWNYPLQIEGREFLVNLFCLPLSGLEVILGLEWMFENHVLLDCHRKKVIFGDRERSDPADSTLLTANQAKTALKEGTFGLLMLFCLDGEKDLKIKELPIIRDFPEVFPEDIPGLPPPREMEFSIDLMPSTGPISIPPYRMSPLELSKLKKQLEELLDKRFVRPSVSPVGCTSTVGEEERRKHEAMH